MVASKDPEIEEPGPDDVYRVGVAGVVSRMLKVPDGTLRILVHGAQRVELKEFVATEPYLVARIEEAPDVVEPSPELEALHRNVQATFSRIIEEVPYLPEELQIAVTNLDDPSELAHMIAGRAADQDRGEAAAARGARRGAPPADALGAARPRARAGGDRHPDPVPGPVGDGQGPARVLAAPAAQGDPGGARRGGRGSRPRPTTCASSSRRPTCPSTPASQAERELQRFERLPPQSVEHGVIRTYLEWLATLPWSTVQRGRARPASRRRKHLDHDHYDIE